MIKINLQGEVKDYALLYVVHGFIVGAAFLTLFLVLTVLQVTASLSLIHI